MMKTLKALSALLTYPTPELVGAVASIRDAIRAEGFLSKDAMASLEPLLDTLSSEDIYSLQEAYVRLFDRSRSLSLNLFEHVHGQSRDRGQAMVDLKAVYEAGGFEVDSAELPDYLPMFLEYCSLQPEAEARQLLSEPAHVLSAVGERLREKDSAYAAVFGALVGLAAAEPSKEDFDALIDEPDFDPDDLVALDAAWEEEEVRFGPASASDCGIDGLQARLRQARRPAPGISRPERARTILPTTQPRA
jgi:nitrate reductase molybdenum cofactor assembly chaperone NarJ/NarW